MNPYLTAKIKHLIQTVMTRKAMSPIEKLGTGRNIYQISMQKIIMCIIVW